FLVFVPHHFYSPLRSVLSLHRAHQYLHSFPTRRSSDLILITLLPAINLVIINSESAGIKVTWTPVNTPRFVKGAITFLNIINRRSEEHTSELQSRFDLVCRLLLEKKKILIMSNRKSIRT